MRGAFVGLALSVLALSAFLAFGRGLRRDGVDVVQRPAAQATAPEAKQTLATPAKGVSISPPPALPRAAERIAAVDPAAPREEAEDEPTELSLRIIDAAGVPMAGLRLLVELGASWIEHTDDAGRVHFGLSSKRRRSAPRWLYLREPPPGGLGARILLAEALAPGSLDLGDVTLTPVPVVVSGVVLLPSGAPCESAALEIESFGRQERLVRRWRIQSAADGVFEVLDWAQDISRLELSVRHSAGATILRRDLAPGTSGVVLALEEGAALVGRVLVDDKDALARLTCELVTAEGVVLRVPVRESGLTPGRIWAGRYSLRVMLAGHAEPIATVEPVVLTDGSTTAPLELNPLDLRGRLRSIGVEVTNEDGLPIEARVRYRSAGAEAWTSLKQPFLQALKLYTPGAALELEVDSEGYRSAVLRGVTADVSIKLRPGYPVVVSLRNTPRLPPGGGLRVDLDPLHGYGSGTPRSDLAGVARFALPATGEYRVKVALLGSGILPTELVPTPRTILVLDRDDEQTFAIALDQAEIDAACKAEGEPSVAPR